jgi:hypothetical protein
MPNITSLLGLTLQLVNIAANNTPLNIGLQGITLPMTAYYYDNFFQAAITATPVPLPATTVFAAYVRNLGTNNIDVNVTPTGAAATTVVLSPITTGFGGVFLYYQTLETGGGGITAISIAAATAVTPCEVFVGA